MTDRSIGDTLDERVASAEAEDEDAMLPPELCAKLRLAKGTFYNYQAAGKFERFELRPRIGPRRYSRKLVRLYLDGELRSGGGRR